MLGAVGATFVAVTIEETPKSVIRARLSSETRTFSYENVKRKYNAKECQSDTYCFEVTVHNLQTMQIKESINDIGNLRDG